MTRSSKNLTVDAAAIRDSKKFPASVHLSPPVQLWVLGSAWAFAGAILIIVVWALTGPVFHYSDTWLLIINTVTTIVTFLMVFLIHSEYAEPRCQSGSFETRRSNSSAERRSK